MVVCASEHRIFHNDAVLPQRDWLSFRDHAGPEHDSTARTECHIATDCGIRSHVASGVDDRFLIVMRQNHLQPLRIQWQRALNSALKTNFETLSVVFVALYYAESEPAPIDAMPLDQAFVVEFHRLYKVHLITVRRGARVFPDESFSVGQISSAVILPDRGLALCDCFKKIQYLLPPTANSLLLAEYVRN